MFPLGQAIHMTRGGTVKKLLCNDGTKDIAGRQYCRTMVTQVGWNMCNTGNEVFVDSHCFKNDFRPD
jgi:hypothetical protein